jgi:hypothetical protein
VNTWCALQRDNKLVGACKSTSSTTYFTYGML